MNEKIDISDSNLNIEGLDNVPICPMCTTPLSDVEEGYRYAYNNPDTRWFWCEECKGHFGYHRMKANWRVDPFDLESSDKLKEQFGIVED